MGGDLVAVEQARRDIARAPTLLHQEVEEGAVGFIHETHERFGIAARRPQHIASRSQYLEGAGDVEDVDVVVNGNNDHRIVWHVDHAPGPAYDSAGNGVSLLAAAWL